MSNYKEAPTQQDVCPSPMHRLGGTQHSFARDQPGCRRRDWCADVRIFLVSNQRWLETGTSYAERYCED